MNDVHTSVTLASSTVLNLRKLLVSLRSGQDVKTMELEVMLCRSITDLAGLLDYTSILETQLRGLNEEDRGVESLG